MSQIESQSPGSTKAEIEPRRVIGRRLAVGFGSVSLVSVLMCAMLLGLIFEVSQLVGDMQQDEVRIRVSLDVAIAVREQYVHEAHWLIEREDEHLDHAEEALRKVDEGLEALRLLLADSDPKRLDEVADDSRLLEDLFKNVIRPAARQGDPATVSREHRKAERLSRRLIERADAVARSMGGRMSQAHVATTRATRAGLVTGGSCILLVLVVSVAHTFRFRHSVLKPLGVLASAAREFGSGNFARRLGSVGDGELREVARAFDHMAEELAQRERKLVASERMAAIGQFAAGVAHEVNNPIGIIRGYVKTIQPGATPAELREELTIIDQEAAACQRIVEDLVAFARGPSLKSTQISMGLLLEKTVRRFRESAQGKNLSVELDAAPGTALADAGRIRQVLLNLLSNAVHVSGPGAPITVTGRSVAEEGYVVAVADRGPGVPEKNMERIFEPFFSHRGGGSGLGLAVSRGIIQAHGGTLTVRDRPGGGAEFQFRLPDSPEGEVA